MYKFLPILLFAYGLAVTSDEIYDNSYALIIGIDKYEYVMDLNYATNDAQSVQLLLVNDFEFKEENTILLLDEYATKDGILSSLSNILGKAEKNDRVIIFFAGHGETYMLPSGGDMGFLVPVDGNLNNLYHSSIPLKSFYDIAEMSDAKHTLYLFDAALGGNTTGLSLNTLKSTPEYIKKITQESGMQIITAGGRGDYVQERAEWGHSAFTRSLLKGLGDEMADDNKDGLITTTELGAFIRNSVIFDTDGMQTPQRGTIGSDIGECVFIHKFRSQAGNLWQEYQEKIRKEKVEAAQLNFIDLIKENKGDIDNTRFSDMDSNELSLIVESLSNNSYNIENLNKDELKDLLKILSKTYNFSPVQKNKLSSTLEKNIYDNSWALIIGINKYVDAPPLKYAVNDANEIKQLLINNFSFPNKNVRILTDKEATLSAIRRALEDIATKSNENDRVIIYFAGHGKTLTLPNGMEIGYLIPVDGDINFPFSTGLAMDNVSTISMLSKSKHMLFLMDACYSGLMAEGSRGLDKIENDEGYINSVSNISARQIITAGGAKQEAMEADEWQHSAFTHNLLKALDDWAADSDADGFITAGELGEYLRKTVTDDTRGKQTPEVGRFRYSESGEFVFSRTP